MQRRVEVEIEVEVQVVMERKTQPATQAEMQLTIHVPELRRVLRWMLRATQRRTHVAVVLTNDARQRLGHILHASAAVLLKTALRA